MAGIDIDIFRGYGRVGQNRTLDDDDLVKPVRNDFSLLILRIPIGRHNPVEKNGEQPAGVSGNGLINPE